MDKGIGDLQSSEKGAIFNRTMAHVCYTCNSECSLKEDKSCKPFGFACDMCQRISCQTCNKTQAQEVRVIPSPTRTLVALCHECLTDFKHSLKQVPKLSEVISSLREEIVSVKNRLVKCESMDDKCKQLDVAGKIKGFEKEIRALKDKADNKSTQVAQQTSNDSQKNVEYYLQSQCNQITNKLDQAVNNIISSNSELAQLVKSSIITDKTMKMSNTSNSPLENNLASQAPSPAITLDNVNIAVQNAMTQVNSQNTNDLLNPTKDTPFAPAKRSSTTIRGTNNKSKILSAAREGKAFYVGNVDPECTENNISDYLKENNIPVLRCEKLNSRDQHVASFKVTVEKAQSDQTILDCNLWPVDIIIKPFTLPPANRNRNYKGRNFYNNRPPRMQK